MGAFVLGALGAELYLFIYLKKNPWMFLAFHTFGEKVE